MKHQLILAASFAIVGSAAQAGDGAWSSGIMVDGSTHYAEYTNNDRTITLYCRNGLHEFIYSMDLKHVPDEMENWDAFDLVMKVDGDISSYTQVAVAWASVTGNSMALHLGRQPAWEFMSSVSGPNTIIMGFSDLYLPGKEVLYGEQRFVFGDGASHQAAFSVLTPCAPKTEEPSPIKPQ